MIRKLTIIIISLVICLSVFFSNALGETLVWDASNGVVDGYRIYYGTSEGQYSENVDVGKVTQYSLDTLSLTQNITYYFVVKAYNSAGESGFSNSVSRTQGDTTPPLPPVGIKVE